METFGRTERFCALPGGPTGAGLRGCRCWKVPAPGAGKRSPGWGSPCVPSSLGLGCESWLRVRGAWVRGGMGHGAGGFAGCYGVL